MILNEDPHFQDTRRAGRRRTVAAGGLDHAIGLVKVLVDHFLRAQTIITITTMQATSWGRAGGSRVCNVIPVMIMVPRRAGMNTRTLNCTTHDSPQPCAVQFSQFMPRVLWNRMS